MRVCVDPKCTSVDDGIQWSMVLFDMLRRGPKPTQFCRVCQCSCVTSDQLIRKDSTAPRRLNKSRSTSYILLMASTLFLFYYLPTLVVRLLLRISWDRSLGIPKSNPPHRMCQLTDFLEKGNITKVPFSFNHSINHHRFTHESML